MTVAVGLRLDGARPIPLHPVGQVTVAVGLGLGDHRASGLGFTNRYCHNKYTGNPSLTVIVTQETLCPSLSPSGQRTAGFNIAIILCQQYWLRSEESGMKLNKLFKLWEE